MDNKKFGGEKTIASDQLTRWSTPTLTPVDSETPEGKLYNPSERQLVGGTPIGVS